MNDIALRAAIPAMRPEAIDLVYRLEAINLARPQAELRFEHDFHAGVYARTMIVPDLPEGRCCLITSAFIRIPTLLIAQGEALFYIGEDQPRALTGSSIVQATAGRKHAILAQANFRITMIFATSSRTIEDAEEEFTNEAYMLQSRHL